MKKSKVLVSFVSALFTCILLVLSLTACSSGDSKHTTHTPGEAVKENEVAATCKAGGTYDEVVYCTVCKKEVSRIQKTTEKLTTHTPSAAVKENETAATCKVEGSYDEVVYCSKCKEELSRTKKTIVKTHTVKNGVCTTCGAKESTAGLEFSLNADGTGYTVTGIGTCTASDIVIDIYNGMPVTRIGAQAFKFCYNLTSVTIGSNVTSIGELAFYNSGLTSITIGSSVTDIGYQAFYYCNTLVEVIDKSTLNITAGSGSDGRVAYYAKEVHAGESKIVNYNNTGYLFYTYNNVNYLLGYAGNDTGLTLPESYNGENYEIYRYAFYYRTDITSVTIPNSVTSIGAYAFYACYKLVEVINKSTLNITAGSEDNGKVAYYAKEVHTGESKIVNKNGYLFYTYDGANCLLGYTGKDKKLTLPDSYNGENYQIYNAAFSHRNDITSITVPNSVTSIGDTVFSGCTSLTSITIPNSVTSIGWAAFSNCKSLTSITIGTGVTSIGYYAFGDCENLTSVYISDIAKWCAISFDNPSSFKYSNPLYYAHNLYLNGELVKDLVIPEGVTSIGGYAFSYCSSLTSVTIPDSVTSIGKYAFDGCTALIYNEYDNAYYLGNENNKYVVLIKAKSKDITSCTVNENCKVIYSSAFYYCTSLASVTIPDSVTSIGSGAFEYCSSLTSITIPDSVTSIGDSAFYGCTALIYNEYDNAYYLGNESNKYVALIKAKSKDITSCTVNENCKFIHSSAFEDCRSLTSVTIGSSVTSIGWYAFEDCTSLTSVYYKGTASEWSNVSIGSYNSYLENATRYYYYSETAPTEAGNYWHYGENGEIVVWANKIS